MTTELRLPNLAAAKEEMANLTNASFPGMFSFPPVLGMNGVKAVTDLGGGVFIFPIVGWPKSLAAFCKQNSQLRVTAIAPAGEGAYGTTSAFVVVTEQRNDRLP